MVLQTWTNSVIPGLVWARSSTASDKRGIFSKIWTSADLPRSCLWDELFFSVSRLGTVRGMHVQANKSAGERIVFVARGLAKDFVVDLRQGSPTYGMVETRVLEPGGLALMVPPGCAHGFEALAEDTTMVYLQQGLYDPDSDIGVNWNSLGLTIEAETPIVSDRDRSLPPLDEFASPFVWQESSTR